MRGRVAVAALGLAASCGFATRSQNFDCDDPDDCDDGRTCVSGWCVIGEEEQPDAGYQPPIVCSPGEPCSVDCPLGGSCSGGIDCSAASSCTVTCSGAGSCQGFIECGDGPCTVDCSGPESCNGSVDCDDACACDVACTGDGSCQGGVDCPHVSQCEDGDGCTSSGAGICDTC